MIKFRKDFENYVPYKIDKKATHNLGDNENRIIDWSDIADEMSTFLKNYKFAYYGNSQYDRLKKTYAEILNIHESKIVQGVGSDQMIQIVIETFLSSNDTLLTIMPDFSMYEIFATIHGTIFETFPMPKNCCIISEDIIQYAKKVNAKMILLSQPNNPTSIAYNPYELEKIIKNFEGIVVIDEAYIDFSNLDSFVNKIDLYENLVVLRTLSKSFGLAGLRIGFAISNDRLIYEINKVLPPYNMSDLVAEFAVVAMSHKKRASDTIKQIINMREDFKLFLKNQNFEVFESQTNFLTFTTPYAQKIYNKAREKDYNFKYYTSGFLKDYIRLSIGTKEEMENLKKIIVDVISND